MVGWTTTTTKTLIWCSGSLVYMQTECPHASRSRSWQIIVLYIQSVSVVSALNEACKKLQLKIMTRWGRVSNDWEEDCSNGEISFQSGISAWKFSFLVHLCDLWAETGNIKLFEATCHKNLNVVLNRAHWWLSMIQAPKMEKTLEAL